MKAAQTLLIQAQGLCDTEAAFEEVSLAYTRIQDAIEAEHEEDATREKRREEADDADRYGRAAEGSHEEFIKEKNNQ